MPLYMARPACGEVAEWSFRWTAPERDGIVQLDVAANSAGGDNSPLQDLVYTLSASLEAVSPASISAGR